MKWINLFKKKRLLLMIHAPSLFLCISNCCFLFLFIWSQSVAEFNLRSINYEVKSPKCHELLLVAPPHDRISFNFRCEQEAQEWATVVLTALKEARRGQSPFFRDINKQNQSFYIKLFYIQFRSINWPQRLPNIMVVWCTVYF